MPQWLQTLILHMVLGALSAAAAIGLLLAYMWVAL